ncbi:MAG TPA: hypothetical protein VGI75_14575 [Pirellulales bacterium]
MHTIPSGPIERYPTKRWFQRIFVAFGYAILLFQQRASGAGIATATDQEPQTSIQFKPIQAENFDEVNKAALDANLTYEPNAAAGEFASANEPRWRADVEMMALWRKRGDEAFDPGLGSKLSLAYQGSQSDSWEADYFGVFRMIGDKRYQYGWDAFDIKDSEQLQSAEINYVHTWSRLSILGGFRFVDLYDVNELRGSYFRPENLNLDFNNALLAAKLGCAGEWITRVSFGKRRVKQEYMAITER